MLFWSYLQKDEFNILNEEYMAKNILSLYNHSYYTKIAFLKNIAKF